MSEASPQSLNPNPYSTRGGELKTEEPPRIWECGDPYVYPIPMPRKGNCWTTLLEPHLKNDKVQCEAWKEEVQYLLIFAGLFSAVVTSFVVESYQKLQADPNDTIIFLLNRLVETSANSNATSTQPQMQPFSASSSSIRVNTAWFLSLILSLTTVLVGIIALQWIREHQKYTDEINSRSGASAFQMRSLGLEEWYIHHIFTALPLLLQGSFILFFIGVVEFLFALNNTVARYVTAAVAFAFLFFVATTALPTLQLFVPPNIKRSRRPPVQCPYRSPQSWIFLRISSHIYKILIILNDWLPFPKLRGWISRITGVTYLILQHDYPAKTVLLGDFKSWILFESWWRNNIQEPTKLEADLLLNTLKTYTSIDEVVFSLYHCFDEVSSSIYPHQYELFKHSYMDTAGPTLYSEAYWPSRLMNPFRSSHSARMMHEANLVWFLQVLARHGHSKNVDTYITSHLIELKSRITAYTLSSKFRYIDDKVEFMDYTQEFIHYTLGTKNGRLLVHKTYGEVDFSYDVSNDLYQASITQAYLVYDTFASAASRIHDAHSVFGTTYNNLISVKFLDAIAMMFTYAVWTSDGNIALHPTFHKTLQFISSTLDNAVSWDERRPLLFLSTSYLIHRMLGPDSIPYYHDRGHYRTKQSSMILPWVQSTPFGHLLDALIKYNKHFKPTRSSPFSRKQLSYEAICLWQVGPSGNLVPLVELPEGEGEDREQEATKVPSGTTLGHRTEVGMDIERHEMSLSIPIK